MGTGRADVDQETLLFTGFPGFIGERLLPRLLELRPGASIRCLIQAKFEAMARASVVAIEKAHPHARGRIGLVVGDITEERLGLSASDARELQRELTGAYHLAAVYDLAVRRDVAERINVQGTRNVLGFVAGAKKLQRLDYVSTAYVSGTAVGVFRETDLDVGQSFKNHYEETKFKAEIDVVKSGLPFAVYRPAIVVGDSRTGETAKFDGPYFALTAMERTPAPGVFIRIGSGRTTVNLVPVDFLIEALARLSGLPGATSKTYHLTDPSPVSTLEIEQLFAKALGKSFAFVPVPGALAKGLFTPAVVQRLFGIPRQALDYFDHPCRYDSAVATPELDALGIRCPRFPDYVQRLVAFYLRQRGVVRREAMS